jgi:hypothetical protein
MGPLEQMAGLLADLPSEERDALLARLQRVPERRTESPEAPVRTPVPLPRRAGPRIRVTVRRFLAKGSWFRRL